MIKKYKHFLKENNIVYSSDEIDPYGEEIWEDDELTPVLRIAKKQGKPYNQIIELECSNKGLMNLEGIENLRNLEFLFCDNNNLTELEEIENLRNLAFLTCSNNNFSNDYKQYLIDYCKNEKISLII